MDNTIDCYTICSHCQSWPGYYTCSFPSTFVRDLAGKAIQPRECLYAFLDKWDKTWLAHPCPFFKGKIIIKSENGEDIELIVEKEGGLICCADG